MGRGLVSGIAIIISLMPVEAWADPVTVIAAAISGVTYTAATATAAAVWGFSWVSFGASLAISAVSKVLTKKPKKSSFGSGSQLAQGYNQQVRQPISAREIVYGEVRKSGQIIFAATTNNNDSLHLMIAVASHEVEEISEVIVDDQSVPADNIDANGEVNSGRYEGVMRIFKLLGTSDQTADSYAVSNIPEWTTNHRGRGIAYVYVVMEWNQNKFPSGIPNFSFWIKGKKIKDTRDDVTKWTANPCLMVRDYLADTSLGAGVRESFIDDDSFTTAANIADEFVTTQNLPMSISAVDTATDIITLSGQTLLFVIGDKVKLTSGTIGGLSSATDYYVIPYQRQGTCRIKLATSYANALEGTAINLTSGTTGTLTKIAEPRYQGGGIVTTQASPSDNIEDMLTSYSGTLIYSGGKFKTNAGSYRLPTVSFDESDLVGPINVQTKVSKQNRFNRIQGIYTGQINDGNPADYPIVKNDSYATVDGEVLLSSFDLPFTQRPHMAQRLAKIQLEYFRQEIRFTASFKLTAFKLQVGDNFYFTFARHGWENKVFEVTSWKISVSGGAPVIEMSCKETASTIWDWNSGEETSVDPAPNSNLPSIFDVSPPTSLAVYPVEVDTAAADTTYKFNFVWTPPEDSFVTRGGRFEIQFRESTEADYRPSYFVGGEVNYTDINQVKPATSYDARVRAVNLYGVQSAWVALLGFTVAAPDGATDREDYGLFSESVSSSLDYGLFSDSVSTSEDYGTFV